ncbi:MAG: YkoF family thiamine/hydroxymethylpyrimidine-binding protein [Anaerolineae bacterium]
MVTAQVSLYPLRQESLAPVIGKTLQILRESSLEVEPDTMSTLLVGDETTIFDALREAFHQAAEQSQVVMVVTFSNACPVPDRPKA